MKFTVQMKDPDVLSEAIEDAVEESVRHITDADERDALRTIRIERQYALAGQWFRYGEYLAVEIDTDAMTARVVEA